VEERLRQILANREVRRLRDESRQLSAVLLPLYRKQGEYYLVFTRRTEQVKYHKGQISFPGGVYEEDDGTVLNTALRECAEEIGLAADRVDVLGALDDVITQTSSYIISPFVAIIPWPYEFRANTEEIEEIIEIPISALLDRNCRREETEIVKDDAAIGYSYHYLEMVIWGATATILSQFLGIFTQVVADS
jgi:8-oxo-dGTP pyrophosphatase MutT (NUDIX family)